MLPESFRKNWSKNLCAANEFNYNIAYGRNFLLGNFNISNVNIFVKKYFFFLDTQKNVSCFTLYK